MTLSELQNKSLRGWNTWYSEDVLSHVLLPYAFGIHLHFRKKSSGDIFDMKLIDRSPDVKTDMRSFDGSYTSLHLRHGTTPIKVESAVKNGEQIILVTPEGYYTADEQLIVTSSFLWGRDGTLIKKNGRLGALCPDGTEISLYSNTAPYEFYLPEWQAPSMFFTLNSPIVISTVPCTAEEACRIMADARAEQHYWRGRIWAPLNYLVYKALCRASLLEEAKELSEKSVQLFMIEWREHRHVHENYSAEDGFGCSARQSDAFYHWGALLAYMGIDSLV